MPKRDTYPDPDLYTYSYGDCQRNADPDRYAYHNDNANSQPDFYTKRYTEADSNTSTYPNTKTPSYSAGLRKLRMRKREQLVKLGMDD